MQENLTKLKAKERNKRALFRASLFFIGLLLLLSGAGYGFVTVNTQNEPENITIVIGICLIMVALFRQYQSKKKEEMNKTA
jgi:cytochrome c biogenesis protein CcdA